MTSDRLQQQLDHISDQVGEVREEQRTVRTDLEKAATRLGVVESKQGIIEEIHMNALKAATDSAAIRWHLLGEGGSDDGVIQRVRNHGERLTALEKESYVVRWVGRVLLAAASAIVALMVWIWPHR